MTAADRPVVVLMVPSSNPIIETTIQELPALVDLAYGLLAASLLTTSKVCEPRPCLR